MLIGRVIPGRWRMDIACAGVLFLVAFSIGDYFVTHWGGRAEFDQASFGPAVAFACGHGYQDPPRVYPSLDRFLRVEQDRYSCSEIALLWKPQPLNNVQLSERYLLLATALIWRVRGVSWSVLGPLHGLFFAIVGVCTFVILRVSLRLPLALAGGVLFMTSPTHLLHLPRLRDYGKAPFILILILILVLLVALPWRPRRVITLCALYGAILGIGLGFRHDLMIMGIPFLCVLLIFLPVGLRREIGVRAKGLVAFVAAFVMAGFPILASPQGLSGGWFVVNHGFMEPFDGVLDVGNALYSRGHLYHDAYLAIEVQQFSHRSYGNSALVLMGTAGAEKANLRYFFQVMRTFPADILMRAYAASLKVLDLPFFPSTYVREGFFWQFGQPEDVRMGTPAVRWFYQIRERFLTLFAGTGIWFAILAVFLLRSRPRVAVFVAVSPLYFCGYPALQFQPRHFFHLEFLGWWCVGFTLQEMTLMAARKRAMPPARTFLLEAGVFATIVMMGIGFPLVVTRWIQQRRMVTTIDRYLSVPRAKLSIQQIPISSGRILIVPSTPWPARNYVHYRPLERPKLNYISYALIDASSNALFHSELLILTFDPRAISDSYASVTFRYEGTIHTNEDVGYDPTLRVDVPLSRDRSANPGLVRVVVPLHEVTTFSHFRGIEISAQHLRALVSVERIQTPEIFPLLFRAVLPEDWHRRALYQKLTLWDPNPFRTLSANRVRPAYVTNQRVQGWNLIGFDADTEALIKGGATDVRLHWLAPVEREVRAGPLLVNAGGNHWIETIPGVRNIVVDGGFENERTPRAVPIDIYHATPQGRFLARSPDALDAHFVALDHRQSAERTSLVSEPIGVEEDHFYLQSADLRCTTCRVVIGRQWLPSGKPAYVLPDGSPSTWSRFAAITRPAPGSNATQLWLLNGAGIGEADFDNVMFLDLGRLNVGDAAPPIIPYGTSRKPAHNPLRQFVGAWQLTGYDAEEAMSAGRGPADIVLHWIAPPGVNPKADPDLRPCGDHCWLQTLHGVRNAVTNGNFVHDDLSFFAQDIYGSPRTVRRIVDSERAPFAELANDARVSRSSFVSNALPVRPNHVYLQAARVWGDPARIAYGRQAMPSGISTFLVHDAAPLYPTTVNELYLPPADANAVQLWLLNVDAQGPARFTDIIFADLGRARPQEEGPSSMPPIEPNWSTAELALPEPQCPLEAVVNDWLLLGYDRVGPGTVALHWSVPEHAAVPRPSETFRQLGSTRRWVQVIRARNLIGDVLDRGDGPSTFRSDIYGAPTDSRRFDTIERKHRQIHFASIATSPSNPRSSLISVALPAEGDHLYLQGAMILSPAAKAYLGRQFAGGAGPSYVAAGVSPQAWRHFASVAASPVEATTMLIWLLNLGKAGEAQFSDLELYDLGRINHRAGDYPLAPLPERRWPEHWMEQRIGAWTLAGVTAAKGSNDVKLFWRAPAGAKVDRSGDLKVAGGGLWMQSVRAGTNLMADEDLSNHSLSEFPGDLYAPYCAQLEIVESGGARGLVAQLKNSEQCRRSSFVSRPITISGGRVYLQSGAMRAVNGNGYVGRQWMPSGASSYALAQIANADWSQYFDVIVAPPKSQNVFLWLLNVDASGTVAFNDVSLVLLGDLEADACSQGRPIGPCRAPLRSLTQQ